MKKTAQHSLKILLETLLGLFLVISFSLGLLAWKLSQGPINLNKLTPYFVDYFNDTNEEQILMENLVLKWEGFEHPIGLQATNVVVSNARGPFLFSPEIDLSIKIAPLLIGKFELDTVRIRNIILSITKQTNGELTITGQPQDDDNQEDEPFTPALLTLNDLMNDLPALHYFWIDDARIVYRDNTQDTLQKFDPVTLFIESKIEQNERFLSGFATFPFGKDANTNFVKLNFRTARDPLVLTFTGKFEQTPINNFLQFAPPLPEGLEIDMTANANIMVQLDNQWALHALNAQIQSPSANIRYALNETTDALALTDFNLSVTHSPKNDIFTVEDLSANLNDIVPLSLSGEFRSVDTPETLKGNVKLSVKDLPEEYFERYWPASQTDNGAYRWLTHKISDGTFPAVNFEIAFDRTQDTRNSEKPLPAWLLSAKGDFEFEGMTIDYNAPMPEAENVKGRGTYNDVELTLDIDEADIGGMKTENASLYFDDLITSGTGTATMTFPVKAQAQQVFDYIAVKPISAFDNIDFKPKETQGDVEAEVKITLPLLKDLPMEEVKVTVEGTVDNATIPNAVKGLTLSGGPYDIFATTEEIKVNGSGQLAGQPITFDWHEYYSAKDHAQYLSKIKAQVTANNTLRQAFVEHIADYFQGPAQIDLDYTTDKSGKKTSIALDLDLKDTQIIFDEIGLNKQAGRPVTSTLNVNLVNGDVDTVRNLVIKGEALSAQSGTLDFKTVKNDPVLSNATLKNVRYDNNIIDIEAGQEGNTLKANITGRYFDITPLLKGDKQDIEAKRIETKTTTRPVEIGINVNEMQTSDTATLKQAKLYSRLNGNAQIEQFELDGFLGQDGRQGKLYVRYTPESEGGLSLRVESDNAGEVLRTFDLYPYVKGGTLQIAGKPVQGGRFGDVEGRARINEFEVMDAPVLLRLLNALSFKNFMQADALRFARLESDFTWRLGENGDIYTVENGRTSGSSIALTFDGFINTAENDMKISGTAAPLSELNKFIGNIPIVGQILTGGGAFLAATYSITGNPDDPSVGVNPLSVLTPGIVRKMLFENNPTPDDTPPKERKLN